MTDSSAAAANVLPSDNDTTPDTPHCRAMHNLLGKTLVCTLDDGRTATGALVCVDRLYVPCMHVVLILLSH